MPLLKSSVVAPAIIPEIRYNKALKIASDGATAYPLGQSFIPVISAVYTGYIGRSLFALGVPFIDSSVNILGSLWEADSSNGQYTKIADFPACAQFNLVTVEAIQSKPFLRVFLTNTSEFQVSCYFSVVGVF